MYFFVSVSCVNMAVTEECFHPAYQFKENNVVNLCFSVELYF